MIAIAKSISYGLAKAEYDEQKVIDGKKVSTEAARQNVYGDSSREVVEEMQDLQHTRKPVLRPFLDIVVTLSEEDSRKFSAKNQSEWLIKFFMETLLKEQVKLTDEEYEGVQWIAYEHAHTDHSDSLKHWHILVNRVMPDGRLISDKWIGKKAVATANKISQEYGLTNAETKSQLNKKDVFRAACFVLSHLREYDFGRYCEGMTALGYRIDLARNSKGQAQGYYITAQSGVRYKASEVDRRLTIGRLETLHAALHKQLKEAARRNPRQRMTLPAPNVPQENVRRMFRKLNIKGGVGSYGHSANREYEIDSGGNRWEDMDEDERRLRMKGYSV